MSRSIIFITGTTSECGAATAHRFVATRQPRAGINALVAPPIAQAISTLILRKG